MKRKIKFVVHEWPQGIHVKYYGLRWYQPVIIFLILASLAVAAYLEK